MWSIYDTCILLSGVITAAIAVLPLTGIPVRTRTGAGLIGAGLIVISLILGNLSSFRYPSIVLIGPLIALCVLGGVIWDARRDRGKDADRQFDEVASGVGRGESEAPEAPSLGASHYARQPVATGHPLAAVGTDDASRTAAWAEVHERSTPSERLTELATVYPEFVPAIVDHPNCYPGLVEWARAHGLIHSDEEH